jgi:hypothetical protein
MKEQIEIIVNSKDLKEITSDILEKVLDNQISDEVLKEIPVVKTLVAIKNVYTTYTDRIFIKKTMNVLLELGQVNWKQRVELTRELDDNECSGIEKILMAINQLETIKKCKVFGKLCKLKALDKLDVDTFSRLTKLIQDSYLDDLKLITSFVSQKERKKWKIQEEDYYPLISLGLIYQEQSEQNPIERAHQYTGYEPEFKGGEIEFDYKLSMLGQLFFEYYYDLFPERDCKLNSV